MPSGRRTASGAGRLRSGRRPKGCHRHPATTARIPSRAFEPASASCGCSASSTPPAPKPSRPEPSRIGALTYKSIASILANSLDRRPASPPRPSYRPRQPARPPLLPLRRTNMLTHPTLDLLHEPRPARHGQGLQGSRRQPGSPRPRACRMARSPARARGDAAPAEALREPRPRRPAAPSCQHRGRRLPQPPAASIARSSSSSPPATGSATRRNLLITGPCGVGKSWLACALGHKACREDLSVLYHRVPRLFAALALARGDGRYAKLLRQIARATAHPRRLGARAARCRAAPRPPRDRRGPLRRRLDPRSPASCRSTAGTKSSASRRSPMPSSTAWSTTPIASSSPARACANARLPSKPLDRLNQPGSSPQTRGNAAVTGRLQIGTAAGFARNDGRLQIGIPGRLRRNTQANRIARLVHTV